MSLLPFWAFILHFFALDGMPYIFSYKVEFPTVS